MASGKVQKFVLREQAIKALGLEDVAKIKTASHKEGKARDFVMYYRVAI